MFLKNKEFILNYNIILDGLYFNDQNECELNIIPLYGNYILIIYIFKWYNYR